MIILKNWCCWGTDLCKCQLLGLSRNQNIKLGYISLIFLLLLTIGLITKFHASSLIEHFGCDKNSTINKLQVECVKEQLSSRWFLALAMMHFILTIFIIFRNQTSKVFNEGIWFFKLTFITGFGFVFMFLVPPNLVYFLQIGSAYLVPILYFFQAIILIDAIYAFDFSLKQSSETHRQFHIVKAFISILVIIGAVIINVLTYTNFSDAPALYVPIIGSVMIVVGLAIVLFRVVKGNTLLVFGFVMLYQGVIGYSLRYSLEDYQQTIFPGIQTGLIILSLLLILGPGSNKVRTRKSSLNEIFALNTCKEQQDNRYVSSNKWIVFQLVFMIICMTIPFSIYQYGQLFAYHESETYIWNQWIEKFAFERGLGWFMILIVYLWTIIAGKLFPEQDFDELQNYFKEFELN